MTKSPRGRLHMLRYWYVALLFTGSFLMPMLMLQLHFNLQTAERWRETYNGFDYCGLHNYIVDFFEDVHDPATKKQVKKLLDWWTM